MGGASCWHAYVHACVAIFVLRVYVLRAFVYFCRRLRWVLPQIKQLSDPLVSLIVCARVCVFLYVLHTEYQNNHFYLQSGDILGRELFES